MPDLTTEEIRVLKVWITSDLVQLAIGGDDSPTPTDEDETIIWNIIHKFEGK